MKRWHWEDWIFFGSMTFVGICFVITLGMALAREMERYALIPECRAQRMDVLMHPILPKGSCLMRGDRQDTVTVDLPGG